MTTFNKFILLFIWITLGFLTGYDWLLYNYIYSVNFISVIHNSPNYVLLERLWVLSVSIFLIYIGKIYNKRNITLWFLMIEFIFFVCRFFWFKRFNYWGGYTGAFRYELLIYDIMALYLRVILLFTIYNSTSNFSQVNSNTVN